MTLKDIRDWLKPQVEDVQACYSGKMDAMKNKVLGLYNRASNNDKIAIGGLNNTSTATKSITILLHWDKNYDTTEQKAKSIYDLFNGQRAVIGNYECFFIMKNDEPVGIGTDDNGIFEFVIDLNIIYKRG